MNLFIGENYIDTVGNKVNVLQLIRQVADDDDIIQSEVLAELVDILDYIGVEALQDAINNGEEEELAMHDDVLYVGGGALKAVFEGLFPGDYTSLLDAFVNSVENATAPTLKLNHNLVPVEQEPDFQSLATRTPQAKAYPVEAPAAPFPGDSQAEEVQYAKVDVLNNLGSLCPTDVFALQVALSRFYPGEMDPENVNVTPEALQEAGILELNGEPLDARSTAVVGRLVFGGQVIPTYRPLNKDCGDITFDLQALYTAVYGMHVSEDHIHHVLISTVGLNEYNTFFHNGRSYVTASALPLLHDKLSGIVEFSPMVKRVVNMYRRNARRDLTLNLLGNPVD